MNSHELDENDEPFKIVPLVSVYWFFTFMQARRIQIMVSILASSSLDITLSQVRRLLPSSHPLLSSLVSIPSHTSLFPPLRETLPFSTPSTQHAPFHIFLQIFCDYRCLDVYHSRSAALTSDSRNDETTPWVRVNNKRCVNSKIKRQTQFNWRYEGSPVEKMVLEAPHARLWVDRRLPPPSIGMLWIRGERRGGRCDQNSGQSTCCGNHSVNERLFFQRDAYPVRRE